MNEGTSFCYKFQLLLNEYVIPNNMTVYQAIRQLNLNKTGTIFLLLDYNFSRST